jgi:xanthine/uracil permease
VTFHATLPESGTAIYEGVLSGDLIGSVSIVFDLPGSPKFAGATVSNAGTATWTVTGGVLPAPLTFATTFDNKNFFLDTPVSPATIFENIGKHRATSGVTKANLQYKGVFDATTGIIDHEYWGVICP